MARHIGPDGVSLYAESFLGLLLLGNQPLGEAGSTEIQQILQPPDMGKGLRQVGRGHLEHDTFSPMPPSQVAF
jgi:hypothetical protein